MSIISLEYIAGLVDGEGYIGFAKHPLKTTRLGYNFQPLVAIQMRKNDEVLEYIAKKYGGFFYKNVMRPSNKRHNYSSISILQLSWRKIQPLLTDIAPFLHVKREQALLMLKYFEEAFPQKRGQNGCFLGDEWLEKKVWYYNRMKELNAEGKVHPPELIAVPRPPKSTRPADWKPIFTKEELYNLYAVRGMSSSQIAKLKGCSRSAVDKYRGIYRITSRSKSEAVKRIERNPDGTFRGEPTK